MEGTTENEKFVTAPYNSESTTDLTIQANGAALSQTFRLSCEKGSKTIPTSTTVGGNTCIDDLSVADTAGDTCIAYTNNPSSFCGSGNWDDDDFTANTTCCACGGGTYKDLTYCNEEGTSNTC